MWCRMLHTGWNVRELREMDLLSNPNMRYDSKWANEDFRGFLSLLNDPESLFERSKEQVVVFDRNENLFIYAVMLIRCRPRS